MERWARMCRSMGALGMAVAKVGHSQHLRPAAFLFSIPTAQNHGGGLFMKSAAIGLWNRIYFKRFGNGVGPEAGNGDGGWTTANGQAVQSTGLPLAPAGSPSSHGSRVGSRPFQDLSLSLLCKNHPCIPSPSSQPQNLVR